MSGTPLEHLSELATFAKIAEVGGIGAAARALRIPKSTVSRRLARLEESLEVVLVQRTSRQASLTEEGRGLLARVAPALASIELATEWVREGREEVRGPIRLTAPTDFSGGPLIGAVTDFLRRYPKVTVDVDLTNSFVDIVSEGYDLALRAGRLPDSSLVARKLGTTSHQLAASPAFLETHGRPRRVEQLRKLPCIRFSKRDANGWTLVGPRDERTIAIDGPVVGSSFGAVARFAVEGAGVALMPAFVVQQHVAEGTLEQVLPTWHSRTGALHLVFPSNRHMPTRVALLRDELIDVFAEMLDGA